MTDFDALATDLENAGFARDSYTLSKVDRLRAIIAGRMTDTFRDVPHFAVNIDVQTDRLIAARTQHNAISPTARISINDLVVKASAVALIEVPEANRSYRPEAIINHNHADIAVVVAIPGGLVTPIVRSADMKSVDDIAQEMRDLAARAQKMRLKPDEYAGGTFSISNLGMYGVKSFGSIINQPHGAILSVGAGRRTVVPAEEGITTAMVMSVTLTCDHRVIDGVAGARWLQAFRAAVESPERLFAG